MIRSNDILGIIQSNAYDSSLSELTNSRTMGSVPFGGRYRLIDFTLSNMVNAGIGKVGVLTKSNYQSLMDHLGTGRPWDLSRKHGGMYLLPPFATGEIGKFSSRIEALKGNMHFIARSDEEYVLMSDCNVVMNFSVSEFAAFHEKSGADITVLCKHGKIPALEGTLVFECGEDGQVITAMLGKAGEEGNYSVNIYFMKKALLERLINDAAAMKKKSFEEDVILANIDSLKICAMEHKGFAYAIDSLTAYYEANMALLEAENAHDLFTSRRPIYTKVRDDMPALYGIDSHVGNSLVSDGCVIKGEVENCILARGVTVEKGAVVKNSVIMQDGFIGAGARVENVIFDKSVILKPGKTLCGAEGFPVFVGKGIVI